jgi:hypothetical protein
MYHETGKAATFDARIDHRKHSLSIPTRTSNFENLLRDAITDDGLFAMAFFRPIGKRYNNGSKQQL